MKTTYARLLVDDTRADEITRSEMKASGLIVTIGKSPEWNNHTHLVSSMDYHCTSDISIGTQILSTVCPSTYND